ncbi:MAG: PD-(D/E)XK nuclease family transposase [Bacteroidaceae bacterium]|nr:PD-(D/E)XK nuclease family transposase [Prevotella sp.]MBO6254218.1 PD-(D/E)XK nuclease family transposase [Bacteroidaceae bacterium]
MGIEGRERFIDPYTDFGFKKLFGTELNKDLLISFLNALFNNDNEIKDVQYLNGEHLGDGYGDRRAVFDVYCITDDGSRFIVEMQKAEQEYFKDRSVFYATSAIREQAPKGKWDYRLEGVYTVGILNFLFPEGEYPSDSFVHEVKLKDTGDNHVFYDKLTFVYLEMPKFNKRESELETMFDKWMFALRNLSRLLERPQALQERIFKRLFEQAEIASFTAQERREYEESVKDYRDYYSTVKTAHNKGRAEGRAEGHVEVAMNLKKMGMSVDDIIKATGLTPEEITSL